MPGMDPAVATGDVVASIVGDVASVEAAVSQLAGEFVYGDTGKALIYYVRQAGEPMDLTGADSVNLRMVRRAGGSDFTVTVTGGGPTLVSDTNALEFSNNNGTSIGTAVTSPASRLSPDIYECRVTFFLNGLTYWTEPFRLSVVKFP